MEKIVYSGTAKPPIHISETDYALIASHAMRLEATAPQVAAMLLDEIDRAEVHSRDELPGDVVTLGSVVTFVDESTGVRRRVQIVLPADADIERSSLSIVSQVGAGLIGLRAGQSIDWPCPDGRPRTLRIVDVEQNPAPASTGRRAKPRTSLYGIGRDRIGVATAGAGASEDWPTESSRPTPGHPVAQLIAACIGSRGNLPEIQSSNGVNRLNGRCPWSLSKARSSR